MKYPRVVRGQAGNGSAVGPGSELLALRWEDFDEENATLTVAGKVV